MTTSHNEEGFSLIEILVVIIVLGVLASVTVFAVRGITDQGQSNACEVEGRTLETAIESYYAQNQSDPTAVSDLVPTYLKDTPDPAKWSFTAGTATTSASFAGQGKCAASVTT